MIDYLIHRLGGVLLGLLLAGFFVSESQADFAAGVEAYDGGDLATAEREWLLAAEAGDRESQVALGGLYATGEGVDGQNLEKSLYWYRQAAALCDPVAQLNLGDFYDRGLAVQRDAEQAYLWFGRAAAQGYRWPQEQMTRLAPALTAAQIARVQLAIESGTCS